MKVGERVTPSAILLATADQPEDEWLAARRTGIGGSDVAALLGMDLYTSPTEIYLRKRGELPDFPDSPFLIRAARWGHLHESLIAAEFAHATGLRTRRIGLLCHAQQPWRLASLDRQVLGCPDGPCGLEIKNRSAWKASEWGESGDPDGVPDREALQTHWYIGVTGYSHFHVGALINGNDDRYYRIEADPALAADVTAIAGEFWQRVLDGDPPPYDGSAATTGLLGRMWRGSPEAELFVDPAAVRPLLAEREQILAQVAELAERVARIENHLKGLLGDKEVAVADGEVLFTWKQNSTFRSKQFAADHPDLTAKYTHLTEVPKFDAKALAADQPEIYRSYRARQFRVA